MWTQPTSGQLLMHTVLPEYALARGKIGNTPSFKVVEPSPKSFPLMPLGAARLRADRLGRLVSPPPRAR